MDAVELGVDIADWLQSNIDGDPAVESSEVFYDQLNSREARVYVVFDDETRFHVTVRQVDSPLDAVNV